MDVPALYGESTGDGSVVCGLCPHLCRLGPGEAGHCRERFNRDGALAVTNYGKVTIAAVDEIERRGLYHFLPGARVLSVGSAGCNMTCGYCLNWRVSQEAAPFERVGPEALVERARRSGVRAIAFTYNEPVIWIEYVLDVARAARSAGLRIVLKTNGYIEEAPLADLLPWVDAMNVDLKAADEEFYGKVCGARLEPVRRTLERCAGKVHLEVTYLSIPGMNDAESDHDATGRWIAARLGRGTPVHLLAYFPRWRMSAPAATVSSLVRARDVFRRHLDHVYLGNDYGAGVRDTHCPGCGSLAIRRERRNIEIVGVDQDGRCTACLLPLMPSVPGGPDSPRAPETRLAQSYR